MAINPLESHPRLVTQRQLLSWAKQLVDELNRRWYTQRFPNFRRVTASDKTSSKDSVILVINGATNINISLMPDYAGHQIIVVKKDVGVGTVTLKTTSGGDVTIPATFGKLAAVMYSGADWDLLYKT